MTFGVHFPSFLVVAALVIGPWIGFDCPAQAQERPGQAAPSVQTEAVAVPGFWDPRRRPEKPDTSRINSIRFLASGDYPPFDYNGPDGNPTGLSVDLARAICDELKVTCTVQARRFDTLVPALLENRGDAIIASLAPSRELRRKVDFSDPYYRSPARFAVKRDSPITDLRPEALEARKIAAVAGTAHEAYLKTFFTEAEVRPYPNAEAAREALRKGEVDLLFGDGIALALWINGTESAGCCTLRGGAFIESRYFGEGIGIAVRRGNDTLRQALNWALFRVWEKGQYSDLWLRYFPVSPF